MSRSRSAVVLATTLALVSLFDTLPAWSAPSPAPNFVVENLFPGVSFNTPTDIVFLPDGRALVTEKQGYVWMVANGVKNPVPVLDIRADVLDQNDRGLISVACDPKYFVNHYVYVLYVVDPDSNNVETNANTFSRLARYTMNFTDSSTVIPSSRRILFGRTWTEGAVSCSDSHTGDDLEWGSDGSLLVSIGDGASYTATDAGGLHPSAFTAGRTDPYENIGAFRSQSLSSLTGKILRLNPATGLGYASNPFADSDLGSKRSRIYAYGLRNPFRIVVRPGTGAADTSAGNPGVIYAGDVGWTLTEEQDIVTAPGRNFGWPCIEGNLANGSYQAATPAHNGCGSVGTADNPNPFTAPMIYYGHDPGNSNFGLSGNTAIGGRFYTAANYPSSYRGYVFGDYGQNWIRVGTLDGSGVVTATTSLVTNADGPVSFTNDPLTGDIVYVAIGTGEVRRIRYTGATGNQDPVAIANGTPTSGPAPLNVSFSSAGTADPDGDPIVLSWTFGDGQGSSAANPQHLYSSPGTYNAILTVNDSRGGLGRDTVTIIASGPSNFPTTALLDDFNRANGTPIDATHPWVRTGGLGTINANQLSLPSAGDLIWNQVFGASQEAYARVSNTSWPTQFLLYLKCQGTTPSAAHVSLVYTNGLPSNRIEVESYDASNGYVVQGSVNSTLAAGDVLGARARADGRMEIYKNGAQIGLVDFSSWPFASAGGRIGTGWWGGSTSAFRADDFGGGDVQLNQNTPPTVQITSPTAGSTYIAGQNIQLDCNPNDAQDPVAALQYHWDVELHHNTHTHFAYTFDTKTGSFPAEDHDDGTGVFLRLKVRVTDTGGLTATDSLDVYPEMDLTPTAIGVTPSAPSSADSLTIAFQVQNLGRLPAPISRWRLTAGNTLLAEGDVVVPALGSIPVSVRRGPLAAGTYTLRARVDTLGVVHETNETNNASVATLVVTQAPGSNRPPVAVASGSPASGLAPLTVAFSSAGSSDPDGDPLGYAWAFGDGGSATTANPSHTYTAAGTYAAILTVTDGRGGSDTASVSIQVNSPPPPSGFPTTALLDDFNRANGTPIDATHPWVRSGGLATINANQLSLPSAGDMVWNTVYGPSQEAFMRVSNTSWPTQLLLYLKSQGTTGSAAHVSLVYSNALPGNRIEVESYDPSAGYVVHGSVNATLAAGDVLGARARADGRMEIYKNGAQIGLVDFSAWAFATAGGRIGTGWWGGGTTAFRTDDFGGGTTNPGNTPPTVAITSPANGSAYIDGQTLSLTANANDAQDPPTALAYLWTSEIRRGSGTTAGPSFTTASASLPAQNWDDGTGVFLRLKLRVTDTGGLTGTDSLDVYPEMDLTPTAIGVTPSAPSSADSLTIAFQVQNLGRLPAPISRWRLTAGNTLLAEGDVVVPALGSIPVSVRRGPLAAGTYTLRARVDTLGVVHETNETNNASVATLVVTQAPGSNRPPVAVASGSPASGLAPLTVAFSSAGSSDPDGDPLGYAWVFGDGGSATTANPSHTYTAAGTYAAILTVTDGRGGSDTASVSIQVNSPPPSGFPTTALLDDFDRANGTPIDATHPWVRSGGLATINANQLSLPSAGDMIWSTVYGASQEAYARVGNTSWPTQFLLYMKSQGTTPTAAHVSLLYTNSLPNNRIEVESYDASSGYVVRGSVNATLASGDVLGARARADGRMEIYKNGTQIGLVDFSAWAFATAGGRIGIGWWGGGTTAFRADDFGGGTSIGAGPALAFAEPPEQPASRLALRPDVLRLSGAHPNPSAEGSDFSLELPQGADVEFTVYDMQGREVWSAPTRAFGAGRFTLGWGGATHSGHRAGAGIYLARVRVGGTVFTRRLVRLP